MIATEEAGLEQEKLGFIEKERSLQSMQHAFNDLLENLHTKENEKNLASQRLNFLREKEESLQEFLGKSEGQLRGLDESMVFTQQQIGEEENKLTGLQEQLESVKGTVDETRRVFDEKRVTVDALRRENAQIQRDQFEAEKKVAVADTSIQNLQRGIRQLEEERMVRESQLKQLEEEHGLKEQELESRQAALKRLQEHQEQMKRNILQAQEQLEGLRQQFADETRKLDAKNNEHDLLKSLIDSMEGYPESIKFLHKNPAWNHQAPILSDIIYVKEEFRAAVENVLEPYLNYYIVKDLQEGMQAVRLLDVNKKGKANFFLLDKIDDQAGSGGHLYEGLIPAMQVIEVDDAYRRLAEHLLGNVYIAENEQVLENSNGAVVLEKSGKFVKGKYSLTGGSVGLFEGKKIGRAKNMEKLQEEDPAGSRSWSAG